MGNENKPKNEFTPAPARTNENGKYIALPSQFESRYQQVLHCGDGERDGKRGGQ